VTALDSLRAAYGELLAHIDALDDEAAWRPTGCAGWTVRDLVFHLLTDAQRALVALGTPADGAADVDAVSYWRAWQPGTPGAQAGRRAIRIMASVWTSTSALTALYGETARAVLVQAARADGSALVATQGHVLTVDDLLATLAVEAAVHHLDLVTFSDRPGPGAQSLALVRQTLDGLLGHPAPISWDDARYVLIGTGRAPLSDAERAVLGADEAKLPLFG
jgi:Mycothiol maleylpyruvate isomerase N-terminal domain